ncbi:MAG: hypothetical protein U9O97_02940 [Elusimicrobiota bacterium]|nr:hypothetical protein [Elusimicrobiota bacterium]
MSDDQMKNYCHNVMRRSLLVVAIVIMSCTVPLMAAENKLRISADKLVYLNKGDITEFMENVVFERDDFKGRSRYLKLDKKKDKVFASGAVSGKIKNTGKGDMSFVTEKLFYEEAGGRVFSPAESEFTVNVSTTEIKDIYKINCSSFTGTISDKQFHLTGKPVRIKGENLSGFSDTLDCSAALAEMRGSAHVNYTEETPTVVNADYIKMNFENEEYEFRGAVKGVFYPKNAENR